MKFGYISIIGSLMVFSTLVSAIKVNCRDCYRVDDDQVTKKCCSSAGGKALSGPTTCDMGSNWHEKFIDCCYASKCESYNYQ